MTTGAQDPSPITGLQRSDWESLADRLLEGVVPFRSASGSLFSLPGPRPSGAGPRSDGMEGFARTFWLAACRIPHATKARRDELVDRYAEGFENGPRREHRESWPEPEPTPQTMVEAGSLAFGLFETKAWLWPKLTDPVKERVADYLLRATSRAGVGGNWLLFRVLAHAFLRSVGIDVDPSQTADDLDGVESCYRGHGWYSDGGGPGSTKFDYYNAWSMNMYPLLWSRMEGLATDPDRVERFRQRSALHTDTLLHMIGADGAPVFQGRSLTYRAAMVSSFWAAALGDVPDIDFGATRRAASGTLDYFVRSGALHADRLSLGWHGEFVPMAQGYSGPASPYWMSKAFLGLLLPPDHQAWTAAEAPLPVERGDFVRVELEPGWILSGTKRDGIVRLINHGTSRERELRDPHSIHLRDDPNYARFAYSTVTAPLIDELAVGDTPPEDPVLPDNSVTFLLADGLPALREGVELSDAGSDHLTSRSRLEGPGRVSGVAIESLSFAHGPTEVRLSRVVTPFFGRLVFSGFAVASLEPGADPGRIDGTTALCRSDTGLRSSVSVLSARAHDLQIRHTGASVFGRATALPVAAFPDVHENEWVVVAVTLEAGEEHDDETTLPRVKIEDGQVTVVWPDGARSEQS